MLSPVLKIRAYVLLGQIAKLNSDLSEQFSGTFPLVSQNLMQLVTGKIPVIYKVLAHRLM